MKNIKLQFYIIFILILISCNSENKNSDKIKFNDTNKSVKTENYNDSIKTNYTDINGLKQGKWVKKGKNNTIESIMTYRNDSLNGYYCVGGFGWRTEGNYKNGLQDGYIWTISGNEIQYYSFISKGNSLWHASYGSDRSLLVPLKGFSIAKDSIYIRAPHYNGKLWYEGLFILRPDKHNKYNLQTICVGIHKIYFETGQLKGIVDYKNKMITEYKISGEIIYSTEFSNFNIHKQLISGEIVNN